ncbi:MAG: hypothetical protein A2X36_00205 [Elusimicrobia bacterium GWA2_69_24]|nr:MAG: hypothetical protein A2X36_00205 [Elusimicrobia bacterium GWA2_69_24]HBL17804.1 hypothetical protein [Elusimicrobiota bacterium]
MTETNFSRKTLLAMAAISFAATFLVFGYEFIRSASASLFIQAFGSARLPYAMTGVPVVLAVLIYGYARLLSRVGAKRALLASYAVTALLFLLCYAEIKAGRAWATALLYIFGQAYIVVIVEQYWAFIDSTLQPAEAKLLNGPIIGGASIGPIVGGYLVHRLAESIGTEQLILLAVAALVPAAVLSALSYATAGEPQPSREEWGGLQGHLHLKLFGRSRTLPCLMAVVAVAQVVSTALSLRFYGLAEATLPTVDARTAYLGGFWSATNMVASGLQFLVTPAALRWLPLRAIHLTIPAIHLASCAVLLWVPTLPMASVSFALFKSFDYSIFRAAREVLYIPLSYDARYRAKQVIDAFTYRFSMGATGGTLSLATAALGTVPGTAYTALAWIGALAWAGLALPLTREESKMYNPPVPSPSGPA